MGNATGDYSVATHDSLSPAGREQAVSLARSLAGHQFDLLLVSPLQRALETLAPYLRDSRQRATIWPEAAECCWQDQREPPTESWRAQPATLPPDLATHFSWKHGHAARPAEDESFGEGLRRVQATLEGLQALARAGAGSVLLLTHGHFIRECLNLVLSTRRRTRFPHANCAMTSVVLGRPGSLEFCNRLPLGVGES